MNLEKLSVYTKTGSIFGIFLLIAIFAVSSWFIGCAPLPSLEDEGSEQVGVEITKSELEKAERDSIIKVRRSFAYERWKNGECETAREHFNVIIQYDIEHKENIYRSWADCFVKLNMQDSALYAYEEGIKYFPEDAYLRTSLAIMFRNAGRIDEAIEQQVEAVHIKPDDTDYLSGLSDLYEAVEAWDKAIETYQRLVELMPDDPEVNRRLTDIIRTYRNPEEYLKAMYEAVEAFPDDPTRRKEYANALLEQGLNEEAVNQFGQYIRMRPTDPDGPRCLAKALQNLGQFSPALDAINKVLELEPGGLPDLLDAGRVLLEMNKWVKARKVAKTALKMDSNNASAWVLMGDIYFKAADIASGDSPKYNDKLVFVIAYGLYRKAAESSDVEARTNGERGMRLLKGSGLVPSREERFMNRNKTKPSGKAYEWINSDWSEVGYINSFLKTLD